MATILITVAGLVAALLVIPLLIPVRPLPGLLPARALADAGSNFITIPFPGTGGITLHFRERGNGGLPFLLLHGFTFNAWGWEPVLDGFAQHGRAVAYDRVPFGLSQKLAAGDWSGENPYTPDSALRQMELLTEGLRMQRPILVGNSAGAFLATRAVLAHPERYRGLILVGPAILRGPSQAAVPLLNTPQLRHLGPLLARRVGHNEWLLRRSYADPTRISPAQVAQCEIATRMTGWDAALWAGIAGGTRQPRIVEELSRISVPTLIIGGSRDGVVAPKDFGEIAKLIPGAELVMMEDAGHIPHEEDPAAFMAAVDSWMRRHFPSGS